MLSWACRRFRARFAPGADHLHRRSCLACEAYAAAVERAARVRLPLPERLRSDLARIADPREARPGSVLAFPAPQIPLPGGLHDRLRAMSQTARPAEPRPVLPVWLRSPRYAVAASYLLTLLLGAAFGNPVDRGVKAAASLTARVEQVWRQTEEMISPNQTRDPRSDAPGPARRSP